jgi:membrane-bound lytic murein transglycosylase D
VIIGNLHVEEVIQKNGKNFGVIRVEAEETLGHYAEWLGVRAQDLRRLNGLRFGQAIRVHQQIKIPLEKVTKEGFEEIRYEYHKEMEEDFFAAYRIESIRHYKVRSGDNIWTLCQNEFELPFWLIRKYNADLNFSGLKPDQKLLVPIVEQLS